MLNGMRLCKAVDRIDPVDQGPLNLPLTKFVGPLNVAVPFHRILHI